MNKLNSEYYLDSKGNILLDVDLMRGDCVPLNTYIIIKNKYPEIMNVSDILLDDINFTLTFFNEDRIPSITYRNDSLVKEGLINYNSLEFVQMGEDVISELFGFIDREKMFIIQTINQLLPHHKDYNPNYKVESFKPGHAFIIIHYDDKYVYFVEDSAQINYANYRAYNNFRKDIGIINIEDLSKVIGLYIKCTSVTLNMEKYIVLDEIIIEIIKKSVANYKITKAFSGESYTGREAIIQLMKICDNENILLNCVSPDFGPINLYLRWKFRALKNKRHTMFLFFKHYARENLSARNNHIQETLKLDCEAWNIVWSVFEKRYQQGNYLWDKSIKKYFERILNIEDELFSLLD